MPTLGGFSRYELLERIGIGGMAEVFRARGWTAAGVSSECVVKKILPTQAQEEDFRSMFMDEGRILALLDHPNVVKVLDLGRMDGDLFIALEYVEGADANRLASWLEQAHRTLEISTALHIGMETLKGLHHAHERTNAQGTRLNILHRDVTPQNVLVSTQGDVKLTDFGIARAAGRLARTAVGVLKGNMLYVAPEQLSGESPTDVRSDVYSAGILLHRLLSGRHPFKGDDVNRIYRRTLIGDIPPPSSFNPQVPPALDAVVRKATDLSPSKRFQTADDFRRALDELVTGSRLRVDLAAISADVKALRAGLPPPTKDGRVLVTDARQGVGVLKTIMVPMPEDEEPPEPADPARPTTFESLEKLLEGLPSEGSFDGPEKTRRSPRSEVVGPGLLGGKKAPIPEGFLEGHTQPVVALGAIRGARYGVSGSRDTTIRIWDLIKREPLRELTGHANAVTSIALDEAGTRLVSGSRDGEIRIWNPDTGALLATMTGHGDGILCLAFSSDGKRVLSGSADETARLWDVATGAVISTFEGHGLPVSGVSFAGAEKLTTCALDGSLRVWSGGSPGKTITTGTVSVRVSATTRDGRFAVLGTGNGQLKIVDLVAGSVRTTIAATKAAIVSLALSRNGTLALAGSQDGTARLMDLSGGETLRVLSGEGSTAAVSFAIDEHAAITAWQNRVAVWDLD